MCTCGIKPQSISGQNNLIKKCSNFVSQCCMKNIVKFTICTSFGRILGNASSERQMLHSND